MHRPPRASLAVALPARLRDTLASVAIVGALAVGGLSCSGGDGSPTEPGTMVLGLSDPSLSVIAGRAGAIGLTVLRGGSFSGPVTITVDGMPAGVTAVVTPATVAAAQSAGVIEVAVAAGTLPATATLTVRARGDGVPEQSRTVALTILPPPAFTMAIARDTIAVRASRSDSVSVTVVRTGGFAGAVTFTIDSLPSGVTAAPVVLPVDSSTAMIRISASQAAALGNDTIHVRGRAAGLEDRTASLVLRVLEAPAFALSLAGDSLVLPAGGLDSVAVKVTRTGGFAGPVTIGASGLPAGVTAADIAVPATGDSAVLVLSATSDAPLGTAAFTVTGAGADVVPVSVPAAVTVVAPPSFTLSFAPDTVRVTGGGSATLRVTATRSGGFAGVIALSADAVPAGVMIAPDSIAPDSGGATLTVVAATTVQPDSLTLSLRGRAEGLAERTLLVPLRVSPLVVALAIEPRSASVVTGATTRLSARVTGHPDTTVSWSSSATAVATVADDGVVTGVQPGVATIVARARADTMVTATATIAVTASAGAGILLQPDSAITGVSAEQQQKLTFRVIVPEGATQLTVRTTGGSGDLDLYVRHGQPADTSIADCMSAGATSAETCVVSNPAAGEWHVLAYAWAAFSGVTISATVDSTPVAGFILVPGDSAISMVQGEGAEMEVSIVRTGGFTGAVTLNIGGLRAGMTAPTVTIPSGSTSEWITITSSDSTPPGTTAAMLRGRSLPLTDRNVPFVLTVSPAAGTGDFGIEAAPQLVTLRPGYSEALSVTGWRSEGLTSEVVLTVDGLPAGVTLTSDTLRFQYDTARLVLHASTGAIPLTRTVVVRGMAPGLEDRVDTISLAIAALPPTGFAFDSIASGERHGCGLRDGEAFCWGNNQFGQLGAGHTITLLEPTRVYTELRFRSISAFGNHTCAIAVDGRAHCWGSNEFGQLGIGSTHDALVPAPVAGGRAWKSISVGSIGTCAIDEGNQAFCWGKNFWGQLGDGTTTDRLVPTAVAGGHAFGQVTIRASHACGVTTAGTALCWGANTFGELGDSTSTGRHQPTPVKTTLSWKMVLPTTDFTCGLTTSGAAYCWGNHNYGYLGDGTEYPYPVRRTPTAVAGGHSFTTITTGYSHTCGLEDTGAAWCWGRATEGQGGSGNTATPKEPAAVADGVPFAMLSAGPNHTCGTSRDGRAFCWGSNYWGQLGDGTNITRYTPFGGVVYPGFSLMLTPTAPGLRKGDTTTVVVTATRFGTFDGPISLEVEGLLTGVTASNTWIPAESRVTSILLTAAEDATIGRTTIIVSGSGSGVGSSPRATANLYVQPLVPTGPFQHIAAGGSHSCALTDVGQAFCWGFNGYLANLGGGALGDATLYERTFPTAVYTNTLWAQITAGGLFTCALDKTGAPYCWGRNGMGQLGNKDTQNRHVPTAVATTLKFDTLQAGTDFVCGLSAGSAYCWGNNEVGQLGDGTTVRRLEPTAVAGGITFRSISVHATAQYACGVAVDGKAYCWGRNSHGQLGTGSFDLSMQPALVTGGRTWKSLSAGNNTTCGIADSGVTYCWGTGANGAVGNGDERWYSYVEPTEVLGGHSFAYLTSASGWSCGTTAAGATLCWGLNLYGHIGDGTTVNRAIPTPVQGALRFRTLSTGASHTCGVTTDDKGYCWGDGASGRLGDGTYSRRLTPMEVKLP